MDSSAMGKSIYVWCKVFGIRSSSTCCSTSSIQWVTFLLKAVYWDDLCDSIQLLEAAPKASALNSVIGKTKCTVVMNWMYTANFYGSFVGSSLFLLRYAYYLITATVNIVANNYAAASISANTIQHTIL